MRLVVTVASLLLMVGGYFASQAAYFGGSTAEYTARLDSSPVWAISLVLLLAAIGLGSFPERGQPPE